MPAADVSPVVEVTAVTGGSMRLIGSYRSIEKISNQIYHKVGM